MELDINVFFQVNMRSSIQPSRNSGYNHKLKPLPLKFYLLFNEQIPLWSAWFHSVFVKLCLFEFLTRSQLLDFLFDIFFGCFFSSSVGRSQRGEPNFNEHATWHACAPSRILWTCASWRFHATWQMHALPDDVRLVGKKKRKEIKHCKEMTKTKSKEDVFEI